MLSKIFTQSITQFISSKSNWTAIGMIAVGVAMILKGDTTTGMEGLFGGLSLLFVKDAIVKTGPINDG